MTNIDYYGNKDNYIHLKWGDCLKMYNFTEEFIKEYPLFTTEYRKYWEGDNTCKFKHAFQIVKYVFRNNIPVHFYYNFTDTPATDKDDIFDYLLEENSYINLK